jgi:hypothetical protein
MHPVHPTDEADEPQARRSARFHTPYARYDVLAKWRSPSFDDVTRRVLAQRLHQIPKRRFFTERQWAVLEAAAARIIPQPDRDDPIPVTPFIDDRLARGIGDGYRFEDMPPEDQAWRIGLAALDAEARELRGLGFPELSPEEQDEVLTRAQRGEVMTDAWGSMPPGRFFIHHLVDTVARFYYAHPDAWSEIGFGGPASPRGYVRLTKRDPWEAKADWR